MAHMKCSGIVLFFGFVTSVGALGQHVSDTHASIVDVAARQAELKSTTDSRLRAAIKSLQSCVALPPVTAPVGRMNIPRHYVNGSNGPINPAEAVATQVYQAFERRISAGMNQYVATGSHAESACALAQLDAWAQAGALLDYSRDESSQAWFQAEWTLSSAGISDSVLVNDATLDAPEQKRVTAWLDKAAWKAISQERPNDTGNNHHDWRALAGISIGVTAADDKLYQFGIATYKETIAELDPSGALPKEMARHENATHYQGFTLQPLVMIAQFALRQGIDLYAYKANGHTLRDVIVFFGRAIEDPSLIKPYASEPQRGNFGQGDFAELAFYAAKFGTDGLPEPITKALTRPTYDSRVGGETSILAAK